MGTAASNTAAADTTAPPAPTDAERRREMWFRVVLLGLIVLILGFTLTLVLSDGYPCVPAAGSTVAPPLSECAVALSPWLGIALLGLVLAVLGYLRVR